MKIRRRHFLYGGVALAGAGVFGIAGLDWNAKSRARALTQKDGESLFGSWVKIARDNSITYYSPHIDFGQGSQTALAQMLAEELDADWAHIRVEQAPADYPFANVALGKGFLIDSSGYPGLVRALPNAVLGVLARQMHLQITGGSTAVRFTGQVGVRAVGAATRQALVETAAARWGVPAAELTTANSIVSHAASGRSLAYGALAEDAAQRTLDMTVKLKDRKDFKVMGQPIARLDIPAKVDGSAQFGIDVHLPDMRVATVMAAPVREGKLVSVDPAPAMAVKGVEKVINLDDAVVVVANGYWPAVQGVRAFAPKFSDAGHAGLSSAAIFDAQAKLIEAGKPDNSATKGDVAAALGGQGTTLLTADYRVPFLHQAAMEPFAMTGHFKDGKLEVWGGVQDPLSARIQIAEKAGLAFDDVIFHQTLIGGGFGRRFPPYTQILNQIAKVAPQLPYPVKIIWSREEDVKQGAYRPQCSARLKAAVGADGLIRGWQTNYAQFGNAESEVIFPYAIPATARHHHKYISNQVDAYWRSVNSTQHGFWNESFMDELAHAGGKDPYQFRRAHLQPGSRQLAVLDAVAQRAQWGTPLPDGRARGIALVESFGTIVAEVVEVSLGADHQPKVEKVYAVVDCGTVVNPKNAEAQIGGGITMGLSAALGEAITLTGGAVDQNSFTDYPILKMAGAPALDIHFLESDRPVGGLGEPGLPPVAPALANALFALTGKRIRALPIGSQIA